MLSNERHSLVAGQTDALGARTVPNSTKKHRECTMEETMNELETIHGILKLLNTHPGCTDVLCGYKKIRMVLNGRIHQIKKLPEHTLGADISRPAREPTLGADITRPAHNFTFGATYS